MMTQYVETKKQYPDCILFYRLGDFYEMFFEDALTASKELEITLTGKECGLEERAPMCGVPYHAVDSYLYKLVQKGYKVAIAEQMEDPKLAKGLVKREVIRVVTPGTITSSQALDETKNNYLMGIVYIGDTYGISTCDMTTGDYLVTEVEGERNLLDEIHANMLKMAREFRNAHTFKATNFEEFEKGIEQGHGFVKAMWCGCRECEDAIKEKTGVTTRCMPFDDDEVLSDVCVFCGKPAKKLMVFAKSY